MNVVTGGGPPAAAVREAAIAHLGDRLMRQGQTAPAKAEIRIGGIAPAGASVAHDEARIAPSEGESRQVGLARLPDEWAGRLERIRVTLDKARRWREWLDAEQGRRACEIAKREKGIGLALGAQATASQAVKQVTKPDSQPYYSPRGPRRRYDGWS